MYVCLSISSWRTSTTSRRLKYTYVAHPKHDCSFAFAAATSGRPSILRRGNQCVRASAGGAAASCRHRLRPTRPERATRRLARGHVEVPAGDYEARHHPSSWRQAAASLMGVPSVSAAAPIRAPRWWLPKTRMNRAYRTGAGQNFIIDRTARRRACVLRGDIPSVCCRHGRHRSTAPVRARGFYD